MSKYRIVKKTNGEGTEWWEVQRKRKRIIGSLWYRVQYAASEESAREYLRKLVAMENITEEVVYEE